MAIGECGLDYDRIEFANKEVQKEVFKLHFDLAEKYDLPMYFHCRSATDDFISIIKENRTKFKKGIIHCFNGNE